jgi:aspartate oxidase
MNQIRCLMWEKVGIIRQRKDLSEAIRQLDALAATENAPPTPALYETLSALQAARLIARCAREREESRGTHYRADFPLKKATLQALHSYVAKGTAVYFA